MILDVEADTYDRALGKALRQVRRPDHSHMLIWQVSESDDSELEAAHLRSLGNRQTLADGGECGCFYCMATFDSSEVTEWVHEGSTALCPRCHIDTVLSGKIDSIDSIFLRRMYDCYFGKISRIILTPK